MISPKDWAKRSSEDSVIKKSWKKLDITKLTNFLYEKQMYVYNTCFRIF